MTPGNEKRPIVDLWWKCRFSDECQGTVHLKRLYRLSTLDVPLRDGDQTSLPQNILYSCSHCRKIRETVEYNQPSYSVQGVLSSVFLMCFLTLSHLLSNPQPQCILRRYLWWNYKTFDYLLTFLRL